MTTVVAEKISLEQLYNDFIRNYTEGNLVSGYTAWGDDALMSPEEFAHLFKKQAESVGYQYDEYAGFADELKEWCEIHLGNLEAKFR
jgi:hypothetical protein